MFGWHGETRTHIQLITFGDSGLEPDWSYLHLPQSARLPDSAHANWLPCCVSNIDISMEPKIYKCDKCERTFKSQRAVQGHQRVHSNNYEQVQKKHNRRLVQMAKQKSHLLKEKYDREPLRCTNCDNIIPYEKANRSRNARQFCNHSCAASFNNKIRGPRAKETEDKIRDTLLETRISKGWEPSKQKKVIDITSPAYFKNNIVGPFSKLHRRTCAHCKSTFVSRQQVKYCKEHSHLYKRNNRNRYAFTFSIKQYPDIFGHMSSLLADVGMWSPSNTNGLTRDHKVSVNEAIRNNYDPFYIKHPLNCELMSWVDNNNKNTKSTISYTTLKQLVDEYESKY